MFTILLLPMNWMNEWGPSILLDLFLFKLKTGLPQFCLRRRYKSQEPVVHCQKPLRQLLHEGVTVPVDLSYQVSWCIQVSEIDGISLNQLEILCAHILNQSCINEERTEIYRSFSIYLWTVFMGRVRSPFKTLISLPLNCDTTDWLNLSNLL